LKIRAICYKYSFLRGFVQSRVPFVSGIRRGGRRGIRTVGFTARKGKSYRISKRRKKRQKAGAERKNGEMGKAARRKLSAGWTGIYGIGYFGMKGQFFRFDDYRGKDHEGLRRFPETPISKPFPQ